MVLGGIHALPRTVAGPRRTIPPVGKVPPGLKGAVDRRGAHILRRLLSDPRSSAGAEALAEADPGYFSRRQLPGGPADGRDGYVMNEDTLRFAVNASVSARPLPGPDGHRVPRRRRSGVWVWGGGHASRSGHTGRTSRWAHPHWEDRVQYHGGVQTGRIGTPQPGAKRIGTLPAVGVDLVRCGFLHLIGVIGEVGVCRGGAVPRIRAPRPRRTPVNA